MRIRIDVAGHYFTVGNQASGGDDTSVEFFAFDSSWVMMSSGLAQPFDQGAIVAIE